MSGCRRGFRRGTLSSACRQNGRADNGDEVWQGAMALKITRRVRTVGTRIPLYRKAFLSFHISARPSDPRDSTANFHFTHESGPKRVLLNFWQTITDLHSSPFIRSKVPRYSFSLQRNISYWDHAIAASLQNFGEPINRMKNLICRTDQRTWVETKD